MVCTTTCWDVRQRADECNQVCVRSLWALRKVVRAKAGGRCPIYFSTCDDQFDNHSTCHHHLYHSLTTNNGVHYALSVEQHVHVTEVLSKTRPSLNNRNRKAYLQQQQILPALVLPSCPTQSGHDPRSSTAERRARIADAGSDQNITEPFHQTPSIAASSSPPSQRTTCI